MFELFHFGNGLVLYDYCLPIYQKLKKDGLLVENKNDLDQCRFKNKNVAEFISAFNKIDLYLRKKYLSGKKPSFIKYQEILLQTLKDNLKLTRDNSPV